MTADGKGIISNESDSRERLELDTKASIFYHTDRGCAYHGALTGRDRPRVGPAIH